jgi:hypothetical protein
VAWRGCTWGLQIADGKWPIARPVALFGFSFQLSAFQLLPDCGFGWLWPVVRLDLDVGSWMFDIGCSVITIRLLNPSHLSRLARGGLVPPWTYPGHTLDIPWTYPGHTLDIPWTYPGHTLDIPWTHPGTIDHVPDNHFDQARLSKSVASGVPAGRPYSRLDVGCSVFPARRSRSAVCLRCPAPLKYA